MTKNSTPTLSEPSLFMRGQHIYTDYGFFFSRIRKIPVNTGRLQKP
jgi:hypothetical protein